MGESILKFACIVMSSILYLMVEKDGSNLLGEATLFAIWAVYYKLEQMDWR